MIHLLLKQPHTTEYVQDAVLDDDVYLLLLQEGWKFTATTVAPGRSYVKLHRYCDGIMQQHWLHRYLALGNYQVGRLYEIHHVNRNGLDNRLDNLQPLRPALHRRLHPRNRRASNGVA